MLVQDYLITAAEKFPEKVAIIHAGREIPYCEIYNAAKAIANWLINEGIHKGDRVAILTDEPSEYVMSYFAILMAGCTVVGLNTQTSTRTLEYLFNHCSISALLTQVKFLKYFAKLENALPTLRTIAISGSKDTTQNHWPFRFTDFNKIVTTFNQSSHDTNLSKTFSDTDIAQIIYTSGTTGKPKGVMLRHSNLLANTQSIIQYLKLNGSERHMVVLPFFYSYGNSILLSHFAVSATLVLHQNLVYPNTVLDLMTKEKVTGFSGVPSTYAILLNRSALRSYKFPNLRYLAQAGGAMSPKLAQDLKTIFPHLEIYIMYGQTEASARLSYLDPAKLLEKAGSIGKAIPEVLLQVLRPDGHPAAIGETGEIVAQGDNIMAGYWNDSEATKSVLKKEGLWTGDLARIDQDGFLYIVSRKNDLIKSGAHRIGPKEIEEVILEHQDVHEVAVFGVENTILGEAINACVVLKEKNSVTKKDILTHCRRNLPIYKVPHHIEFLTELPKTTSGKIKKNELRDRFKVT